ncbi:MAG TPA: alpha-amylase family glycosyl hydrolase [Bacteroidota bacterium]|nr:alpha-amylase family glycosyl hydrolase [Bacteroidota bacterium]
MTISKALLAALPVLICSAASAQQMTISKVEPPNWWSGMTMNQIQLMVTGENLDPPLTARSRSPQVRVTRVYRTPNSSYAFIDIEIAGDAFEGFHLITLYSGKDSVALRYPILRRKSPSGRFQGTDAADVIYLITPDRFANGDTATDRIPEMTEGRNRSNPLGRHGGDLKGIIDHLDYLADLGVTALWITPLLENNAPTLSYHGYAATDLYRIDPRFGTNAQYEELVREAHKRKLKVVMDHVSNHIGINHPWMKDLPSADWLNGSAASHQHAANAKADLIDIHSDSAVRAATTLGWFTDNMPDLNQRNSFVARYLIQNTLWWIESTGLDAIREDTYPYADPHYLGDWARCIMAEYPSFSITGEVWIGDPAVLAAYQKENRITDALDTDLTSLTDYALFDAFTQVFANKGSIRLIHDCLAKDYLYWDPYRLMTFVDNHDVRRIMYETGGDVHRSLLALKILLTTRGMPELLYGSEIGMMGGKDHGTIRADFPGGFPGDSTDAFTARGRSTEQNEYFRAVRQLLHLRKEHRSLAYGKLFHFPPVNETYTYIRILGEERIVVLVNNRDEAQMVSLVPLRSYLSGKKTLRSLTSSLTIDLAAAPEVEVPANDALILGTH